MAQRREEFFSPEIEKRKKEARREREREGRKEEKRNKREMIKDEYSRLKLSAMQSELAALTKEIEAGGVSEEMMLRFEILDELIKKHPETREINNLKSKFGSLIKEIKDIADDYFQNISPLEAREIEKGEFFNLEGGDFQGVELEIKEREEKEEKLFFHLEIRIDVEKIGGSEFNQLGRLIRELTEKGEKNWVASQRRLTIEIPLAAEGTPTKSPIPQKPVPPLREERKAEREGKGKEEEKKPIIEEKVTPKAQEVDLEEEKKKETILKMLLVRMAMPGWQPFPEGMTQEEAEERLRQEIREVWLPYFVLGARDVKKPKPTLNLDSKDVKKPKPTLNLDSKVVRYLLKLAGFDIEKIRYVKPGSEEAEKYQIGQTKESFIAFNLGGREVGFSINGLINEAGKSYGQAAFDHHHPREGGETSTSEILFNFLVDAGFLKREQKVKFAINNQEKEYSFEALKKAINFVTQMDNWAYPGMHRYENWRTSYQTLVGLHMNLNLPELVDFFSQEKADPLKPLTDQQLKKYGLEEAARKRGEMIKAFDKRFARRGMIARLKEQGRIIQTRFGDILVDPRILGEGEYPVSFVAQAARAVFNCQGYLFFDPEKKTFFFNLLEGEFGDFTLPTGIKVRNRMIVKKLPPTPIGERSLSLKEIIRYLQ